nr:hypothetical protein [Tanacetum cinerariifolium]GEX15279.1 hypothetical protein [Tanacetum cinerariifolium]
MDLFAFIHTLDPTKVKIVERERVEDEPLLLQTTVSQNVPLLPVAPHRVDSELETSIKRLFDEGGSGSQAGQGGSTSRKRKTVVADAGGSSHPPKKLREDHGTPSGASVAGTSRSAVQRLLAEAAMNAEVSDYSHHSGTNVAEAEVDSLIRSSVPVMIVVTITTSTVDYAVVVIEKTVKPSLFAGDSSSAGGVDPNNVYVPRWSMTNGSRLDDGRVCHKMVDEFAPLKFFASVWEIEQDQLFIVFNVRAARQMSLSAKVRIHAKYNVKEKRRLKSAVEEKDELLKSMDKEIENLKAHMVNAVNEGNTILEKERDALDVKVVDLEVSVVTKECEMTDLNAQLTSVKFYNDSLVDQVRTFIHRDGLHLEERFYPHLLTTISGCQWLLTHGMKLAITKCLHSSEYISALELAIGKAIEKGMHDGLSAGITHGAKGRVLTYVAAYNPSTEADYISALQHLQNVNFPLLAELRSNKDVSVDTVTNILRLEGTLAERLGLTESQPHVDQLMVPIHYLPDQVFVGASALSLAFDVSSSRVWKIKENIGNCRSALHDFFVALAEPLSDTALTGIEGTSNIIFATADTTMDLSTTLASASIVSPISMDDYKVAEGAFRSLNLYAPFPSASVTSYGPSHLEPSFPMSFTQLASLLRYTRSTSVVLSVGMPISVRITSSISYANENVVSPLLDFIIVWCAHRT